MITTKPAAACIWASSNINSPYWVWGPPCTFNNTGYFWPGSTSGIITHASISAVPSVQGTAMRRHERGCTASVYRAAKSVSRTSAPSRSTNRSATSSTAPATTAIVPAAAWRPRTVRAPSVMVSSALPSRWTRRRWVWPRSSALASKEPADSHSGSRNPAVHSNVRSKPVVTQRWSPPSTGTTPMRAFWG